MPQADPALADRLLKTRPMGPKEGALQALALGLSVFPVIPCGKRPYLPGWQDWARAATPEAVEQAAAANPDLNWGILCDGLLGIDLDVKGGNNGLQALQALLEEDPEGRPKAELMTLRTVTPSGGRHLIFRLPPDAPTIRNAVSVRAGIDVRTTGGLLVCWGSITRSGPYMPMTIESGFPPLLEAPAWLVHLCHEATGAARASEPAGADGTIDWPGRNQALFAMAAKMRHAGFGKAEILAALSLTNLERTRPPVDARELERIIDSACRYDPRTAPAASLFAEELGSIPDEELGVLGSQLAESQPPERDWIMPGRILARELAILYGPGGAGKSTLLLALGASVASGKPLMGWEVRRPCQVWYHQGEDDISEIWRRLRAIAVHHNLAAADVERLWITTGRELRLILATSSYRGGVARMDETIGLVVRLIRKRDVKLWIVDPLAWVHACEENSNDALAGLAQIFAEIMQATGCAILLGHHTRKGKPGAASADDARGASAIITSSRLAFRLAPAAKNEHPSLEAMTASARSRVVSLIVTKANILPPGEARCLLERRGIQIGLADEIGTLLPYHPADLKAPEELPPAPDAIPAPEPAKSPPPKTLGDTRWDIPFAAALKSWAAWAQANIPMAILTTLPTARKQPPKLRSPLRPAQIMEALQIQPWARHIFRNLRATPQVFQGYLARLMEAHPQACTWTREDGTYTLRIVACTEKKGHAVGWVRRT